MRRALGLGLAAAMLVAPTACGGGESSVPSDAAAPATLQQPVNRAGAGTAIADCRGLDRPVPGASKPERSDKDSGAAVDKELPDLTLACLGGGDSVTLSDLRGPMLLNVWASWCGPCKDELPYLQAAKQVVGERVRFAAIAVADQDALSRQWMSFHGVTWPSVADPESRIRGPLRVPGPPVTLFVGSDGTIAETHYGAFTSAGQVTDAIAEHLGVTA